MEPFEEIVFEDTALAEGILDPEKLASYRKKYFERLDVVDDDGNIVASAPRGYIHRVGLRHRTVNVLIHQRLTEFLLQSRGSGGDRRPGRIDISVAGHIKAGERDFKSSALREMEEELGLTCDPDRLLLVGEFNRNSPYNVAQPYVRNRERRVLFLYELTDTEREAVDERFSVRTSPSEVDSLKWLDIDDALELIHADRVADGLRGCFLHFLAAQHKARTASSTTG